MREIRVLVVDDNRPFRDLLARFIGTQQDLTLVGAADDGAAAVTLSRGLHPDVVLMDLCMPTLDGFEATRRIKQDNPDVTVIALTAHRSSDNERLSIEAGADGFLPKAEAGDRLIEMIRQRVSPPDDSTPAPS